MLVQPETVVGWQRCRWAMSEQGFDNGKGLLRVLLIEVTSILFSIIYGEIISAMFGNFGGTSALCVNTRWNFNLMRY